MEIIFQLSEDELKQFRENEPELFFRDKKEILSLIWKIELMNKDVQNHFIIKFIEK